MMRNAIHGFLTTNGIADPAAATHADALAGQLQGEPNQNNWRALIRNYLQANDIPPGADNRTRTQFAAGLNGEARRAAPPAPVVAPVVPPAPVVAPVVPPAPVVAPVVPPAPDALDVVLGHLHRADALRAALVPVQHHHVVVAPPAPAPNKVRIITYGNSKKGGAGRGFYMGGSVNVEEVPDLMGAFGHNALGASERAETLEVVDHTAAHPATVAVAAPTTVAAATTTTTPTTWTPAKVAALVGGIILLLALLGLLLWGLLRSNPVEDAAAKATAASIERANAPTPVAIPPATPTTPTPVTPAVATCSIPAGNTTPTFDGAGNGILTLSCTDGSQKQVVLPRGPAGAPGADGMDGTGCELTTTVDTAHPGHFLHTITCGSSTPVVISTFSLVGPRGSAGRSAPAPTQPTAPAPTTSGADGSSRGAYWSETTSGKRRHVSFADAKAAACGRGGNHFVKDPRYARNNGWREVRCD